MAHSKQAKKRVRQNEKRRLRNKAVASRMRTEVKKVMTAVAEGNKEKAQEALPIACKRIDKAAKNHVIHDNAASRKKSQVMKAVASLG